MALTRIQKTKIFQDLEGQFANQKSIILLTTKGTNKTVNSVINHDFRSEARRAGVIIQIAKNTLIQKSFKTPKLVGQTYIAYLEDSTKSDEVTIPKIIVKSVKKSFSDNFEVLGCIVGGEFLDSKDAKALADTPTKLDSISMIAGSINQLATKLALVIKEIPTSVVRGIKAVHEK